MALIRTSFITQIAGSVGGIYYQRDKNGLHIKKMPRRIKSRSVAQKQTERFFQVCKNAFGNPGLSTDQRNLWNQYAIRHPMFNKIGEAFVPTVQLIFMRHNLIRVRNGLSVIYLPPAD